MAISKAQSNSYKKHCG